MTGYTRQSSGSIIAGEQIKASALNAEFNSLATAFDALSGHTHDGTTGSGGPINFSLTSATGVLPMTLGGTGVSASSLTALQTALGITSGGSSSHWTNPITFTLTGDVTGSVSLDGSTNVSLATTIVNDVDSSGGGTSGTTIINGGGGEFNQNINTTNAVIVGTTPVTLFTCPSSTVYVIDSIQVANIDGSDQTCTVMWNDSSSGFSYSLAYLMPVKYSTPLELLRQPKIVEAGDTITIVSSGASSLVATISAESHTVGGYRAVGYLGNDTTADIVITGGTHGTVIQSLCLTNTNGTTAGEVTVDMQASTSDTNYYQVANNTVVPSNSSLELFDQPKFLPSGKNLRIMANQAGNINAVIAAVDLNGISGGTSGVPSTGTANTVIGYDSSGNLTSYTLDTGTPSANEIVKLDANGHMPIIAPSTQTLTDASSIAINCSLGQIWVLSTAAVRNFIAPTNGVANTSYRLILTTNGYTPTWTNSAFKFAGGSPPSSLSGICIFDFFTTDGNTFYCTGQSVAEG